MPCRVLPRQQYRRAGERYRQRDRRAGRAWKALNTNRCSLAAGGSRSISGNNVTVTLPFTFNTSLIGGAKNVYVAAYDVFGGVTHWVQTGIWTVQ